MSTVDTNATVDTVTEGIDKVDISVSIKNDDTSEVIQETCAACGKEGNSADMNTCNKCKSVKYCNAACKKKHRSKHKKACERRVAELHDEQLFKDHPPREECPLCFQPMPLDPRQLAFHTCCGKVICKGCDYAMAESEGKQLCPYCRTPPVSSDEENIKRLTKLMDKGNGNADVHFAFAGCYAQGTDKFPRDMEKAIELLLKAGELGSADAYCNLGDFYNSGEGVEMDKKKAKYYLGSYKWEYTSKISSFVIRGKGWQLGAIIQAPRISSEGRR